MVQAEGSLPLIIAEALLPRFDGLVQVLQTYLAADEPLLYVTSRDFTGGKVDVSGCLLGKEVEVAVGVVFYLEECVAGKAALDGELSIVNRELLGVPICGVWKQCYAVEGAGGCARDGKVDAVLYNGSECLCLPLGNSGGKEANGQCARW